jgi:hypothetical protein
VQFFSPNLKKFFKQEELMSIEDGQQLFSSPIFINLLLPVLTDVKLKSHDILALHIILNFSKLSVINEQIVYVLKMTSKEFEVGDIPPKFIDWFIKNFKALEGCQFFSTKVFLKNCIQHLNQIRNGHKYSRF